MVRDGSNSSGEGILIPEQRHYPVMFNDISSKADLAADIVSGLTAKTGIDFSPGQERLETLLTLYFHNQEEGFLKCRFTETLIREWPDFVFGQYLPYPCVMAPSPEELCLPPLTLIAKDQFVSGMSIEEAFTIGEMLIWIDRT